MSNNNHSKSTLDGLPKTFVSAMRTLFEILDDRKTGFVKFTDIESRWQENGTKELPRGVLESLRKVTPPNGYLSFERFCAGLKICLLRHRSNNSNEPTSQNKQGVFQGSKLPYFPRQDSSMSHRPASVPLPDIERRQAPKTKLLPAAVIRTNSVSPETMPQQRQSEQPKSANTATVRPNNAIVQQRAVSMPQLQTEHQGLQPNSHSERLRGMRGFKSELRINIPTNSSNSADAQVMGQRRNGRLDKNGIMDALQNWRLGMIMNNDVSGFQNNITEKPYYDGNEFLPKYYLANREYNQIDPQTTSTKMRDNNNLLGGAVSDGGAAYRQTESRPAAKKAFNRRREPRRHTLANGIDYNMLKRMKQFEQERDILFQGLEAVERARDWYQQQIGSVQEKMRYVSKTNTNSEYSTDAYQEKLNFQMTRIFDVNQHITALIESNEKGFPLHMNLAVRQPALLNRMQQDSTQLIIQRLKEQNRMLTQEVGNKSERITQLEREKSSLIRELFQARTQHRREIDDTAFM
ncbi:suppressor APC domain-containing protein 2-like [Tachypleus tridentatus]|uniref:suppressor APC domain-containing protein 2-like n=1 Tax=Tachypleus tridentatus TaxID=6853 RepID=UPI003FD1D0D4